MFRRFTANESALCVAIQMNDDGSMYQCAHPATYMQREEGLEYPLCTSCKLNTEDAHERVRNIDRGR